MHTARLAKHLLYEADPQTVVDLLRRFVESGVERFEIYERPATPAGPPPDPFWAEQPH